VKPQFEVGKERVGSGGVVRDPALRAEVVGEVAAAAGALGLRTQGVVASPLPGPSGNVEYFLWLRKVGPFEYDAEQVAGLVARAVEEGPQ
jgi:23S rRNA (cytidine1920-2'-O)/16S rRNA (cytidine1409-2'-O)-methyltransferase